MHRFRAGCPASEQNNEVATSNVLGIGEGIQDHNHEKIQCLAQAAQTEGGK